MNAGKKIREELNCGAPDLADKIAESVNWDKIAAENSPMKKEKKPFEKSFVWSLAAACCAVVLCLGILLPIYLSGGEGGGKPRVSAYSVTIQVNPSIRLDFDEHDIVTRQYGLNEDGVLFLHKENYVGQTVDEATEAVVQKLGKHGFLNGNAVKVCVKDGKGNDYDSKQSAVAKTMEKYLTALGSGSVSFLDEDEFKKLEDDFKDKNLGEYEKSLIERYKNTVLELAKEKEATMRNLISLVSPYAEKDGKKPIPNLPCLSELTGFAQKYGYEYDFETDEITGKDLYELIKDLNKEIEDLLEAVEEIEDGKDEDDFKDLLKDLYELAEDHLFEED